VLVWLVIMSLFIYYRSFITFPPCIKKNPKVHYAFGNLWLSNKRKGTHVCVYILQSDFNQISHLLPFNDMSRWKKSEETQLPVKWWSPYIPSNQNGASDQMINMYMYYRKQGLRFLTLSFFVVTFLPIWLKIIYLTYFPLQICCFVEVLREFVNRRRTDKTISQWLKEKRQKDKQRSTKHTQKN
jgi:hypothetical protein